MFTLLGICLLLLQWMAYQRASLSTLYPHLLDQFLPTNKEQCYPKPQNPKTPWHNRFATLKFLQIWIRQLISWFIDDEKALCLWLSLWENWHKFITLTPLLLMLMIAFSRTEHWARLTSHKHATESSKSLEESQERAHFRMPLGTLPQLVFDYFSCWACYQMRRWGNLSADSLVTHLPHHTHSSGSRHAERL